MERFVPKKIDLDTINGGNKFKEGDTPTTSVYNDPIEASAWAQNKSEEAYEKAQEALDRAVSQGSTIKVNNVAQAVVEFTSEPQTQIDNNKNAINNIWDTIYPIGSIYMNVSEVEPAQLFGGEWAKIEDTFLYGSGTKAIGTTGGEETHTLSIAEMPKHTHTYRRTSATGDTYWVNGSSETIFNIADDMTQPTGGDQPHNNMPPYIVINIWKRIA